MSFIYFLFIYDCWQFIFSFIYDIFNQKINFFSKSDNRSDNKGNLKKQNDDGKQVLQDSKIPRF